MLRFTLCALCLGAGLFFEISAVIGVYRFDTALRRMHAAALGDTLGLFFILLSLTIAGGVGLTAAKYLLLLFLFWNTSPIASHLIGKLELETHENLSREVSAWKR